MERAVKEENIAALKGDLAKATSLVLADFRGITVKNDTALRREFRLSGCKYQVVKNTLLGRAVEVLVERCLSGAKSNVEIVVIQGWVDDFVSVLGEVSRFDAAWNGLPAVEEEDFHYFRSRTQISMPIALNSLLIQAMRRTSIQLTSCCCWRHALANRRRNRHHLKAHIHQAFR